MKPISMDIVIRAVGGRLLKRAGSLCHGGMSGDLRQEIKITGVSTDTRTLVFGDLFVPLVGERFDGHQFIKVAAEKGAAAILTHNETMDFPEGVHVILVTNTLKALQDLAAYYLSCFKVPVVAVTGSTGKTTTKDMIASVLSQRFRVLKTQGNLNNEIGLPLTVFRLDDSHEIAVLEMGMSGFGEIHRLVSIARPTVGIIINIGVSHMEKLGSRENILKAKLELFDRFEPGCTAILNYDDKLLASAGKKLEYPVISFGIETDADIKAHNIKLKGEKGTDFTLEIRGSLTEISLKVPGLHNIYNSLAAAAAGTVFGLSLEEIRAGLAAFETGEMRLNTFKTGDGVQVIDDAYNASPDSMKAALAVLRDFSGLRRIAVLGDMLELGEYSEEGHRIVGRTVVKTGVDILAARGDASRAITDEAIKSGMDMDRVFYFTDNQAVIDWLEQTLKPGDTILIKGSRGMKMEEITSYLKDRGN